MSVHRRHEPYRRAITGIYARLAASAWTLNKVEALRHAVGEAPAYASAAELRADLDVLDASLVRNGSENVARGRLRNWRAVDVFGFHLAAIDLRQNSDVHERVIAELYEAAGGTGAYRALAEEERIELLGAEIANARPLASITLSYSDETVSELSVLRAAVEGRRRYGAAAVQHYVISKTSGVSDLLETAILLKEVGLLHPREHRLDVDIVPLFETIDDLRRSALTWTDCLRFPSIGGCWPRAAMCRK